MTHAHSRAPESAPCLFCAIARGAAPAHVVAETDALVAFLDIHPIRPGHAQIIPRAHFATFDELPPALAAEIVGLGQQLARALKRLHAAPRVGFLFTGGDIAHVHAHVTPLLAADDITSRRYIVEERVIYRNTPRPSEAALSESAAAIRAALAAEG